MNWDENAVDELTTAAVRKQDECTTNLSQSVFLCNVIAFTVSHLMGHHTTMMDVVSKRLLACDDVFQLHLR